MAANRFKPLLDREFLKGELAYEYQDYCSDGIDAPLLHHTVTLTLKRIGRLANRAVLHQMQPPQRISSALDAP